MSDVPICGWDANALFRDVSNPPGVYEAMNRYWLAFDADDTEIAYSPKFPWPNLPTGTLKARITCFSAGETSGTVQFNISVEALGHDAVIDLTTGESWGSTNAISGTIVGTVKRPTVITGAMANIDSAVIGNMCRLKIQRSDVVGSDLYLGLVELYVDQS